MHYTEFINKNLNKLKVNTTNDKVKYFDPCKLGRYLKIYDEPPLGFLFNESRLYEFSFS